MKKQFYTGLFIGTVAGGLITSLILAPEHRYPEQSNSLQPADSNQPPTTISVQQYTVAPHVERKPKASEKINGVSKDHAARESYSPIKCTEECSQKILNKFLSGYMLTADEIDLLNYGSHHVAATISGNLDLFESFKTSVLQGVQDSAQFAVLRVIYHLPTDQSMSLVDQLSTGSDNDRVNAVNLLAMLSDGKGTFAQRIETSIQTETSPVVLAASIGALNSVAEEDIGDVTLNTISGHLLYNDNPVVKGKALEVLTQLQHYDANVQHYIQEGLDSPSVDLQLSSMQSLSNLLNIKDIGAENQLPAAMRQRIIEIANTVALPPDVRMQALSLMNTYM